MELELIVTFAGIVLAGVAGVLGVWMERDREAPQRWAWVFSSLIVVAVGIEMVHSVAAEAVDSETEDRMATVLEQLAMLSTLLMLVLSTEAFHRPAGAHGCTILPLAPPGGRRE